MFIPDGGYARVASSSKKFDCQTDRVVEGFFFFVREKQPKNGVVKNPAFLVLSPKIYIKSICRGKRRVEVEKERTFTLIRLMGEARIHRVDKRLVFEIDPIDIVPLPLHSIDDTTLHRVILSILEGILHLLGDIYRHKAEPNKVEKWIKNREEKTGSKVFQLSG